MKMCVQRKAGRRQRARRRFASRLYPSHGPLWLLTSRLRKTKRLRRTLRLLFAARYENFAVNQKASIFVSYVIKEFAHAFGSVRISSYGCTWEVWRALKKLELRIFRALQTSRVRP